MNEKELRKLLALEETETLEFKQSPNSSFYKTISAFANTKDGMILLGVDKNRLTDVSLNEIHKSSWRN